MRRTGAVAARGLTALICSLLMVFQPILGAPTPLSIGAVNRGKQVQAAGACALAGTIVETMPFLLLFFSFPKPAAESSLIAVAKLTGTVDRNGQPLVNGSIVSSGDLLSTHGDSALLLASAPQEKIWLGPNTSARFIKEAGNVVVAFERGTLGFQTQGHVQVTFEKHDGLAIRSRANSPALAQLSFVNNQEAQVRVQEGSLELVQGGRSVLLQPEGSSPISTNGTHVVNEVPTNKNSGAQGESATGSGTGLIRGTVVNTQLLVLSGADVTLTNVTGKTFTTHTNQEGKFTFNSVPPGTYTLHVTRQGYKSYDLPNVPVRAGNESTLFVTLAGGGAKHGASNNLWLWIVVGGAAAGGIGAYLGTRGGSSSTSPSSASTP
jgi:hypothetical protein